MAENPNRMTHDFLLVMEARLNEGWESPQRSAFEGIDVEVSGKEGKFAYKALDPNPPRRTDTVEAIEEAPKETKAQRTAAAKAKTSEAPGKTDAALESELAKRTEVEPPLDAGVLLSETDHDVFAQKLWELAVYRRQNRFRPAA